MEPTRLAELLDDLHTDLPSPRRSGARLCAACVELLAVDGAGILLVDDDGHASTFGVSDAEVARLEELQFTLGEGPGIDAHLTGRPVWEPDVARSAVVRWPAFGASVLREGFGAAFAIPLRTGAVGLGALDLYVRRPGPLAGGRLTDTFALAEVVMEVLLALQTGASLGGVAVGIDVPGGRRALVHQAAGMISEQLDIPIGDALVRLRGRAYATQRPVGDVARDITERRVKIDEVPE